MQEESEPKETGFLRRPAHTEAEDWIVYHPDITPTALMLYMRLRGAVMDPSSSAEDWKKATRFTINEMRRLLPRAQGESGRSKSESTDPYVSDRTIQRNLGLLMKIGALRRVDDPKSKSQVPMYDFPMYPPDAYDGPVYGGAVGRAIRKKEFPQGTNSVVTIRNQEGCHTCRGVSHMSGEGDTDVTGGCHACHPRGTVTCDDGAPKEALREEESLRDSSPPPPLTPPLAEPSGPPLRGREDEEEKTHAPPAGRPAAERHPGTDEVINAMGWPKGTEPRGDDLNKIRSEVSKVLRSGWTQERLIKHLVARMRWDKANDYTAVCLWVLAKCPEDPSQGRSALEEAIESLEAEIAARDAAVAVCAGCDGNGWTEQGRHDHGRRGMDDELWELKNPEQAAINRSLNAKTGRAA